MFENPIPWILVLSLHTFLVGVVIYLLIDRFTSPAPKEDEKKEKEKEKEKERTEKISGECEDTKESCACKENPQNCCKSENKGNTGQLDKLSIYYGSTTGRSETFAKKFASLAESKFSEIEVINMKNCEAEERLPLEAAASNKLVVFIVSTYTEGAPPEDAKWFFHWVQEAAQDFRVQHSLLKGLHYCVVGLGNSDYSDYYNVAARQLDKYLFQLSAERFHPLTLLDENENGTKYGSMEEDFMNWQKKLISRLQKPSVSERIENFETGSSSGEEEKSDIESDEELVDLEDLGTFVKKAKQNQNGTKPKEMLTASVRQSLTKQGYKIVGGHSAVKICRWTKAMLRGRGGCYKHTFYGIESHRCMETTPSLACANKCVFCWRHHSNPVGTEWKWNMDPPEMIIDGALENHYKMIKQMKGVPGVLPDKLEEGMNVQHCALSLVGEPIMYPEINKFVRILHNRRISSFLVTNAQFPDEMKRMEPCTQLYVSIDASTKDSLKKIDRPLHKDFWERFTTCLAELSHKGQRTVYRLTIVKGFNEQELDNYAKLVEIGKPDFIEVKGVTYCGTSKASTLTMDNVPWHEEVIDIVEQLAERLPQYGLACEHEHSNCVLMADKKFLKDGVWQTWINYSKFHDLVNEYYQSNGEKTFNSMDYSSPTPPWAVFGCEERGFDPQEKRFHRKNRDNDG